MIVIVINDTSHPQYEAHITEINSKQLIILPISNVIN